MAKLLKLQIFGIRSFAPYEENSQQVKFLTPMTLFLGQNGCGKTTIIEAISYACTGIVPGGTNSGKSFINDPKIFEQTTSKGQIKLNLVDPKGNEIIICREEEVRETKSGKLEFAGKNHNTGTVKMVNPVTGEERNDMLICNSSADTTTYVCQVMDVSKSILNNVIFCHQDNSSWPMDEGQKLKQKFDEIFDTEKYNKATDLLRNILKERQHNVNCLDRELSDKKDKKEAVEKLQRNLQDKKNRLSEFEGIIAKKREELGPIILKIEEICELEKILTELKNELTAKEQQRKGILEQQAALKKNIPEEFTGTDEELQKKIQTHSTDRKVDQEKTRHMEEKKSTIELELREIRNLIQKLRTDIGGLNQDKVQNERRCAERTVLMKKAISEMKMRSLTDCANLENAEGALLELKAALKVSQDAFLSTTEQKEAQETDLQNIIDGIRDQHTSTKEIVQYKKKEIKTSEAKLQSIGDELIQLSTADELLKHTQTKLEDCKRSISTLRANFNDVEEERKITRWNNEIRDMERKQEELGTDLRILQENNVTEVKLQSENDMALKTRETILSIRSKHTDDLKHLFGEEVPQKGLKAAVEALQDKNEEVCKDLVEKINEIQRDIAYLKEKYCNQKEKVESCEKDIKVKKDRLFAVCKGKDLNEVIEATYKKKADLQKDKGKYSSAKTIYETFLTTFEQESPCCPVCLTDFRNNHGALAQIKSHIRAKIDTIPNKLSQVLDELEREDRAQNSLQQLKRDNDDLQIAEATLPFLKDELQNIVDKLNESTKNLGELQLKLQKPQENVQVCCALGTDIAVLDQKQVELDKSLKTISHLKEQIVEISSRKTKQEVEAEIDTLKNDISDLKRKVEAQRNKREDDRNRMEQLLQEQSVNMSEQMSMQKKMHNKPRLEEEKNELTKKIEILKIEVQTQSGKVDSLNEELQNTIEAKRKACMQNKQQVERERNKMDSNEKMIHEIEKLQNEITNYERRKIDVVLQNAEKEEEELINEEVTLNEAKDKIIDLLSSKKEECAKRELEYRTLQDNIDLRAQKALESAIDLEIVQHKQKIGGYNYTTIFQEKQQLLGESDAFKQEIISITGQKREVELSITELADELETEENRDAHKNYLLKYYELQVVKASIHDLTKYTNALEKAILEFHKSRMVEINRTIREHWRNIYRGNDIDYIEIRTKHVTSNSKKRSYDYTVVQMRRGVELEMRGRCSAGQKVLACLIIRLAIAETLSAHCGIFALDEPTTNLDKANIISLSHALARLVSTRQNQKNFQLLIITHDEDFINTLTRLHGVSHYFEISRDGEGFSIISEKSNI